MTFDRQALDALFDYTTFTWEAYGKAIRRLPEGALTKPVESSGWPALRNVLMHIALAWDNWQAEKLGVALPAEVTPESISSWEELDAHRQRVRGWLRRVIDETPDGKLTERSEAVLTGTPGEMSVTVAELLAHILLHERGHHGDVSTLLSQLGAEPPPIDYMTYVFFQQRR